MAGISINFTPVNEPMAMITSEQLLTELNFTTARSGGSGGQNVNKVETMVQASWCIEQSTIVTQPQKQVLLQKFAHQINSEGFWQQKSQTERTQLANKQAVVRKMVRQINVALVPPKKRLKTKPTKSSLLQRKEAKLRQSEKKQNRTKQWW